MRGKISIVLFWALILICVVALFRLNWQNWREHLGIVVLAVPIVFVTNRFLSRFTGRKKRMALIMLCSVEGAIISGGMLYWDRVLLNRSSSMADWAFGAIFLICCWAMVWSLFGLRRPTDKLPT